MGFSSAIEVGDLNGDGIPDIVTSSKENLDVVNVLLGNGDGTFQAARTFDIGPGLGSVPVRELALVDVNNDGVLDIVVSDPNGGSVSVLLGNGDGTFKPERSSDATPQPDSLAVGDFNGDGIPDLVVLERTTGATSLAVLIGKGDGTFKPPQLLSIPWDVTTVAVRVGDFTGTGKLDLAVFGQNSGKFQIFLGNGNGTFTAGGIFSSGEITENAQLADINGDNKLDIVTAGANTGSIYLILGNGDGTFQAPQQFVASPPLPGDNVAVYGLVIGDFGAASGLGKPDGYLDIAVTAQSRSRVAAPQVFFLAGQVDGHGAFAGFAASQVVATLSTGGEIAAADLNKDGVTDLVVGDGSGVRVIYGQAPKIMPNDLSTRGAQFGDGRSPGDGTAGHCSRVCECVVYLHGTNRAGGGGGRPGARYLRHVHEYSRRGLADGNPRHPWECAF